MLSTINMRPHAKLTVISKWNAYPVVVVEARLKKRNGDATYAAATAQNQKNSNWRVSSIPPFRESLHHFNAMSRNYSRSSYFSGNTKAVLYDTALLGCMTQA